ncbi:hypothetical protein [Actinomadura sp. CNU-125]|uniref:hypothetical protein n=1 Tax=Actinomadura sp. CNU-125 TaxID=1904961 RepID=UPI0013016EF2|nr:hypothetical protein [Actinomadura sp. CNU-125]
MAARPAQQGGGRIPDLPPHVVPAGPDFSYDPPAGLPFVGHGFATDLTAGVAATVQSAAALPTAEYPHWWTQFTPETPSTVVAAWGVMLWCAPAPAFDARLDPQMLDLWKPYRAAPLPDVDGPRWLTPPTLESLVGLYAERLRASRVDAAVVVLRTMWAVANALRGDVRFQTRADALLSILGTTLANPTVDYDALPYGDQAIVQQWLTRCPPHLVPALRNESSPGDDLRHAFYTLSEVIATCPATPPTPPTSNPAWSPPRSSPPTSPSSGATSPARSSPGWTRRSATRCRRSPTSRATRCAASGPTTCASPNPCAPPPDPAPAPNPSWPRCTRWTSRGAASEACPRAPAASPSLRRSSPESSAATARAPPRPPRPTRPPHAPRCRRPRPRCRASPASPRAPHRTRPGPPSPTVRSSSPRPNAPGRAPRRTATTPHPRTPNWASSRPPPHRPPGRTRASRRRERPTRPAATTSRRLGDAGTRPTRREPARTRP